MVDGRLTRSLSYKNASLAGWAAESLSTLGIDSAPHRRVHGYPDLDVPKWKEWWKEVQDGELTFGFKGDPKRYNYLGVVREDGSVIPLQSKFGNIEKQTEKLQVSSEPKPPSWIYWVLGTLIFVGVGMQVWNSCKGSSAS